MNHIRRNFSLILFIVLALGTAYIIHDLLFSEPTHQQGLMIDKVYVPGRKSADATPYGGVRRGKYFVVAQRVEQWVAIVKLDNGDTVQVHCHPDHYQMKDVGQVIHFKKYEGEHLHIRYFAHNEQEE